MSIKNLPLLLVLIAFCMPLPCVIYSHKNINQLVGVLSPDMVQDKIPLWSSTAFFSGTWQKRFSNWFNEQMPLRKRLIHIHNQIYFDLFHRSYMSNSSLVIGKKQYLYDMSYIIPYCNLNRQVYSQKSFDQWAKNLEDINQFFLRRGQKFIYVITASKAAYYPQYFPSQITCKDIHPDYIMAKSTLAKTHVPYVDGSEVILNNRPHYGNLLFSRGGMHWTLLAATLAANGLAKKISAVTGIRLPKMTYSYTISFNPKGWDPDLIFLANLAFPDENYIVPVMSYVPATYFQPKRRLKLAVIGGSFMAGVLDAFDQTQLFARIDYYFYFKLEHHYFVGGSFVKYGEKGASLPFDPNDPHAYQNILDADVVILEENENLITASNHLQFFLDWLRRQPGWSSEAPS